MSVSLHYRRKFDGPIETLPYEVFQFPGGELQLRNIEALEGDISEFYLYVQGADPHTIMTALLLQDYVSSFYISDYYLVLPYLPAARSDRGEFATLSFYTYLLRPRQVGYDRNTILTLDVHNFEALKDLGLTNETEFGRETLRVLAYNITDAMSLLEDELLARKYTAVIAPDEGAVERASDAAQYLEVPAFAATKSRDFETGKLTGFQPPEGLDPQGHYLLVDDICDGGGTFAGLIDAIHDKYPDNEMKFDLWVTHGVFSGSWIKNIWNRFESIFTTNSHTGSNFLPLESKFYDSHGNLQGRTKVHVADVRSMLIGETN